MMKIAVIGTGHVGGILTRRLTRLGHDVSITNLGDTKGIQLLANETGAKPASIMEAAHEADVVILSIPIENIPALPPGFLLQTAPGAVIIDTSNYYSLLSGSLIAPIEMGMTESCWVEQQIHHPVIKALNTIAWFNLMNGRPKGHPERIATPVAGDDPVAKDVVCKLVEALGFDAVDAGGLDHSWRQQPGTSAFFAELDVSDLRIALSEARPERGYGLQGIYLDEAELQAELEMSSSLHKQIAEAVHILMQSNQWTEAEAARSLFAHFTTGTKLAHEVLEFVMDHKRLA